MFLEKQDVGERNLNMNFFSLYSESQQQALLKQFYKNVTQKIEAIRARIAIAVQELPGARGEGFGTGFFYEKSGWPFFITAKHVVDDIQKNCISNRLTVLFVRGRKGVIKLPGLEFFCRHDMDFAAAPLWKRPKETYAHVDFFNEKDVSSFSGNFDRRFFAFTGFPTARNKTYTGQPVKPNQRNITMFIKENPHELENPSPFLYFGLDSNHMYDSNFEKMATGIPHGMSGGPVFEVENTFESPLLKLAGVGLACLPEANLLKAMRFDLIDIWLDNLIGQ